MSTLTATLQEHTEVQREREWRTSGVSDADVAFSRVSGMDGRDVRSLREFSSRRFIIVVRCPKVTARVWHGTYRPKPLIQKDKTGSSGLLVTNNQIFVSDYDLMSIWRINGEPKKIFVSAANGAVRGKWTPEAMAIVVAMNQLLVSRIQHGCQDDFQSSKNPGVKASDHFAVFHDGATQHLVSGGACADYYRTHGLDWPYDAQGEYIGPKLT